MTDLLSGPPPDARGAAGEGPLARLLQTRGGTASPEAPFLIEHREALIYLLCQASELEHTIMCQYLYAAFSLKERTDEGLSEHELAAVRRWRKTIGHVAAQEMLHLALVQNVLSAVGGAPHLGRPNLPVPAGHFPAAVVLELLPFGEDALQHFMFLERPEGMALDDAAGLAAAEQATSRALHAGDIVPLPQDFATIGHLYRSIEAGLEDLTAAYGEAGLFVGPPRAQATRAAFGWPELVAVTDLASARRALDTILEQGEGARGDWREAHFGQFVDILDELRQLKAANPDFDPVRPVRRANVRPSERGPGTTPLIGDEGTARCVDLFNVGYEVLLLMLERFFAHTEESEAQLQTLADAAVAVMLQVLRPLGSLITTLPVGPQDPQGTAGPSFELFYETDYLMPHQGAAWALLEERLRDAAAFCDRCCAAVPPQVADSLVPITGALGEIADSLAAHFAEWGAVSRFSAAAPAVVPPATRVSADVVRRAAELSASRPDRGGAVTELLDQAHRVLLDLDASPVTDRAAAGEHLVDRALRPLADALRSGLALPAGQAPSASDPLWSLALTATGLRASLVGAPAGGDALIEATAGLQDLALRFGPADLAAEGLAQLRALQADLGTSVRAAADGPYLATNTETLTDHLGQELPTRPQLALCRCGASASKPLCDGSHARTGFTDGKDPKRVPDRRDTYVGQQVTVLDNRGICQHSGLCTDRLASVFHAGADPFVTPSGARMDDIVRAVASCPSGALSFAVGGREAREQVDPARPAVIEVSLDGPYRVTGGVALTGPDGAAVERADGSSTEHYALCRCGQSQNKPFCSGMHYYVGFSDPTPPADPSVFAWAGGLPALTAMTRRLLEKHVPDAPLLRPLFASMTPDLPEQLAAWMGQALGGPQNAHDQQRSYERALAAVREQDVSEAHRARLVELLLLSAAEVGMPDDARFAVAFRSFVELVSRSLLEAAGTGAVALPPVATTVWGWGSASGAPAPVASEPPTVEPVVALPPDDVPVGFAAHIQPLFRERDRASMRFAFDLWSYDEVLPHAQDILERVRSGNMPCDAAWPADRVAVLQRWVDGGTRP